MQNIDYDLRSVQEVRDLARLGQIATEKIANYTEDQIDRIIRNMVRVAEENAVSLAQMAVTRLLSKPPDRKVQIGTSESI